VGQEGVRHRSLRTGSRQLEQTKRSGAHGREPLVAGQVLKGSRRQAGGLSGILPGQALIVLGDIRHGTCA